MYLNAPFEICLKCIFNTKMYLNTYTTVLKYCPTLPTSNTLIIVKSNPEIRALESTNAKFYPRECEQYSQERRYDCVFNLSFISLLYLSLL